MPKAPKAPTPPLTPDQRDHYRHTLARLGIEYYAIARQASGCTPVPAVGHGPVCGTQVHHALELFMKAVLVHTGTPIEQLRSSPFGHNLNGIWTAIRNNDPALAVHDALVASVHRFEDIRYPDQILELGMTMSVGLHQIPAPQFADGNPPPHYEIVMTEIDRFVVVLFDLASLNPPAFVPFTTVRDAIVANNPVAARWG